MSSKRKLEKSNDFNSVKKKIMFNFSSDEDSESSCQVLCEVKRKEPKIKKLKKAECKVPRGKGKAEKSQKEENGSDAEIIDYILGSKDLEVQIIDFIPGNSTPGC